MPQLSFSWFSPLLHEDFLKHKWRSGRFILATAVAIVTCLAVFQLGQAGLFSRFEPTDLDNVMNQISSTYSDEITLVTVDEDDYRNLFGARSPLPQKQLTNLISAILQADPKVLAVDFETDIWKGGLPASLKKYSDRLIWARKSDRPVLGLSSPDPSIHFGLPVYYQDSADGTIRHYGRATTIETK